MPRTLASFWAAHTLTYATVPGSSGNKEWKCRYCLHSFTSTSTRLVRHCSGIGGKGIGGCKDVPREVARAIIEEYPREFADVTAARIESITPPVDVPTIAPDVPATQARDKGKRPIDDIGTSDPQPPPPRPSPHSSSSVAAGGATASPVYRGSTQQTLSFARLRQKEADIEIGRCFIECNMSFNIVRTEQWKRMVQAISRAGYSESWYGPDYRRLRTTILDDEIARISTALQPIRESWATFGCTILSDGWTDVRRRHIISIMVSSCLGTFFLRAVDAGEAGQAITAEFIYEHIRAAILDVGVENVVQVITDNASNCRRMGEMVEAEFPSIVWTPCAAHCVDLLMEDIGRLPWVSGTIDIAREIVRFFRNKSRALGIFRSFSDMELIRPSATRFAYMYMVLRRLGEVRDALRMSVVSPTWAQWPESRTQRARDIMTHILDEGFWTEVDCLVATLQPMYLLIRVVDSEGSTMGLMYHAWRRMRDEMDVFTDIIGDRYDPSY